ncbi:sugar ABC transporter permease [Bifidobacterium mongoliense]|uniref:Carbohydrate ABC transporter membrane protein 2, CUT1 family n=1 Tax=Bifidobacterium mongoliense DSM 21395 TaxID=1437603 RepID=A0A087C7M2_9BIFI|nr:ABC transporter permease subunit [Bifidobacterium mongoliense]KFI79272.1 carbohydrate ABC transporter membrane protein 2, CUT1 family [Bifidobacterium mongoliense DSM 21395]
MQRSILDARRHLPHVRNGMEIPRGTAWWRQIGWRHVVGIGVLGFMLFPVLYVVSASFNPLGSIAGGSLIPRSFTLEFYRTMVNGSKYPFMRWYGNTLLVALVVAACEVMFSTMAAYSFSRLRFRGRRGGLLSVLLVQMFPQFLSAVALFTMMSQLGRVLPGFGLNTLTGYALILMGGTMGNVWLMKGFFDSIPHEIDEAAEIDGAGHVTIFVKVLLPLVTPILAVNFLLTFIHVIGEYMLAAIFLTDDKVKTLAVGLYGIIEGDQSGNLGLFCAGSILLCIPVVLLFLYLQKYITSGMTAGAVKS